MVHSDPLDLPDHTADVPYTLRAPGCPASVTWARTFATSLATSYGLDPDACDDIRLAVSVIVASGAAGLHIDTFRDVWLTVFIGPWPVHRSADDIDPWDIIDALLDEAALVGSRLVLRLSVRPPSDDRRYSGT